MPSFAAHLCKLVLRYKVAPIFTDALTIEERRSQVQELSRRNRLVSDMTANDVVLNGVRCTWVDPEDEGAAENAPVLLYLHGGAFIAGGPHSHMFLPARLAKNVGMRVLMVAYSLAPERPYPAAVNDVVDAYRALLDTLPEGHPVVFSGDSAGGCVAVQALMRIRQAGMLLPRGALLFSPVTDVLDFDGDSYASHDSKDPLFDRETLVSFMRMYSAHADRDDPSLCPKRADLTGLPPMFIDVGEYEVLHSDAVELAARAEECGVPVEFHSERGLFHGYPTLAPLLPEANAAVDRCTSWLRARLDNGYSSIARHSR